MISVRVVYYKNYVADHH